MKSHLRAQVDWEQPFTPEEYAERRRRVRETLAARGWDAIYVTNPADLTWLTGYDMIWYHLKNLTGLLMRADRDEAVFFDSPSHTTIVSTTPEIGDVVYMHYEREHLPQLVEGIAARGLSKATIALQPWNFSPHGSIYTALTAALALGGARVEDGLPGRGAALREVAGRGRRGAAGRRHRRRGHGRGARRHRRGRHGDRARRRHHGDHDEGGRRLSRHPHHAGLGPARRHPPQPAAAPQDQEGRPRLHRLLRLPPPLPRQRQPHLLAGRARQALDRADGQIRRLHSGDPGGGQGRRSLEQGATGG